ncbi:tyrosinase family protein [Streptomyces kanamyceticus]|uniref:Tyrosinase family protein n=1 Tax=Streptomyces kanamyceticus TaxID=1967 RepID=A0A5J6GQB1_STRKN|nr:tyrosinase family protein [Streptomyces kanamyceticus]QEU97629.1 tyrosinase family protein [Streptomyces kanamyceticus]
MAHTRKNQSGLSRAERRRFVDAVLKLKRSGRYDEFVRTHIDYYVSDGERTLRVAHMTPSFFPWHRRFLLEFERALQRVDAGVTVPYWDWTKDRTPAVSLWGADLMGGNGRPSDGQVTTGPFAYGSGHWTVKEGVTDGEYLTRNLGRAQDPMDLPTARDVAWAMEDSAYDAEPWDSTSEGGFRNRLEGWTSASGTERWRNHNRVHRWVGGHMLGGASVNDPVFWLHHAFVDLLWDRWQRRHPDSAPYLPERPPRLGEAQYRRIVARHEPMPPWDVRPDDLLEHKKLYRYGS